MSLTQLARFSALFGYFGLLTLLIAWFTVLAPSTHLPTALLLLIVVGPLLFPLRGLLHGKPYTHAWVSMLALLYFTHGVIEAWSNRTERTYALLEILFSVLLFLGSMLYARWRARELKQ
ncbi:MAG: DUF2069 domain-containing protein [Gammaproteobacteria bacterium]